MLHRKKKKRNAYEYVKAWRSRHPVEYAYLTVKYNAKRRKKPFDLTLEEFKKFCRKYDYIQGKGRSKECISIDCKINELGYTKGNIKPLSVSNNARKGTKVLEYDWRNRTAFVRNATNEKVLIEGYF